MFCSKPKSLILLATVFFVAGFSESAAADVLRIPGQDERGLPTNDVIYKITVTPAGEMVPAFKYRLTIEPHKTIAGNAITHYLRSLAEKSLTGPWDSARERFGMDVYDWSSLTRKDEDVPLEKLRTAAGYFDNYVDNLLRRATLCRDCDWGLAEEDLRGVETVRFLLPSVQQTRSMARALMLRNRLAVMEGRYEDSIDHLRMTYQLGKNVNQMKFLVANLVGIAEVGMANEGMLSLIGAKGSPNMYWALAELPQPIISIRESVRLESSFGLRYFPVLMDVENAEFSPEEWTRQLNEVMKSWNELSPYMRPAARNVGLPPFYPGLLSTGAGLLGYASAKNRLVESGMDPDRVEKMAVAQVLLIDAARDYRLFMNAAEKEFYVPLKEAAEFNSQYEKSVRVNWPTRIGAVIVESFGPALTQVRLAEIRVQAQVNVLMAIESIRDHIATTGKLPERLDDLKLPIRDNPYTGEPFKYELMGDTAVLLIGRDNGNRYSQRFEISIAPQ